MAIIADVTNFNKTRSCETHPFGVAGSTTKHRVAGVRDWVATFDAKAQGGGPPFADRATGTLKYTEATSGYVFEAAAVCQQQGVVADFDTGAPVAYSYSVEGNGDVTTETGGSDSAAFTCSDGSVEWS